MPQNPARIDGTSPIREPRPKRVKIDTACDLCRSRKVKCDGERPVCGNCSRRLETRDKCSYNRSRNSAPKRPIAAEPDVRVRHHGSSGRAEVHRRPALGSSSTVATVQPTGHSTPCLSRPSSTSPVNERFHDSDQAVLPPATVSTVSPSAIDSMTAVVVDGPGTQGYFGNSSAGSFTAQIRRAIIDAGRRSGESTSSPRPDPQRPTPFTPAIQFDDTQKVLPTRKQADSLLRLYWEVVHPLYPFLDKPRWEASYRAIFDGSPIGTDEHIFQATLNVIFAISTQLLESQSTVLRAKSTRVYFDRAQNLVPLNTWEPGSVELVQYLLLASQYLQSTDQPHQTWMVVASAVRIAQSLGLHLSDTSEHSNPQERELLRTVWYGCVLMDRIVAVTHGRPAMVSSRDATVVPFPLCSTPLVGSEGITQTTHTDTCFFVKSVELYEITHRIIQSLYHGARCKSVGTLNEEKRTQEALDLGTILELETSLGHWEQDLPARLKWTSPDVRNPVTHRQAIILSLRFFHAKITLLRPVLASFCLAESEGSSDTANTLETRTLKQCALICVSTAQSIISALADHQSSDGTVGLLPAWWYRFYYVYTAATVLIAAKLRPDVFREADFGSSWIQAMSILRSHEKFGQSARRCGASLRLLSAMMRQDGTEPESSEEAQSRDSDDNHDALQSPQPPRVEDGMVDGLFNVDLGEPDPWGSQKSGFDVANLLWLDDMRDPWVFVNQG